MPRNRASAKKAGTEWESEICRTLVEAGWLHAERRRLGGQYDKGDVAGIPGIVIEAKNEKTINLATSLNEAHVEKTNANAKHAVAWLKRRGRKSALGGYVVMDGDTFINLLKEAGY